MVSLRCTCCRLVTGLLIVFSSTLCPRSATAEWYVAGQAGVNPLRNIRGTGTLARLDPPNFNLKTSPSFEGKLPGPSGRWADSIVPIARINCLFMGISSHFQEGRIMPRSIGLLFLSGILLTTTSCAQSIHQLERASVSSSIDAGYAEAPYWGGPGYRWYPFGYYGSGYGWSSGGHSGGGHRRTHHHASPPSPPPTPPSNAPPQFKK
jgi:hypothetical protein